MGATYYIQGVPYSMVNISLQEFDVLVQQAGISNYPERYATDVTPLGSGLPANLYVWPPAGGVYTVFIRYYRQMPDIVTPEISTTVPWFTNTNYLFTRLAGELMKLTDDERYSKFLGDSPDGAQGILDRYLKLQDDDEGRVYHPPVADVQTDKHVDHNPRPNERVLADYLAALAPAVHARLLVSAGHIHNYERQEENGVTYLVSGGGGAKPYEVDRTPADLYQSRDFPNYHYVRIEVGAQRLVAEMVRLADPTAAAPRTWEVRDRFELAAPTPRP